MTESDYRAWLARGKAERVILAEAEACVGGVETVRRLSTAGYNDGDGNHYAPLITGDIKISERLPLDGSASFGHGDIELINTDGRLDGWLNDIWCNRPIALWLGDPSWPRADFRRLWTGVIEDIAPRRRGRLNIVLRDKLQRLNTPVSEKQLGGATQNKDRLIPVALGECSNVEPLLIDPPNHVYQYHNGPSEGVIEVRDNGIPVPYLDAPATGTFRLTRAPEGQITATVQGDKPGPTHRNTVAALIHRLVTGYGNEYERFTGDDLDLAEFGVFSAAHPQPVGVWLPDRANVLEVAQRLAASVGAQLIMTRSGLLRLIKIARPSGAAHTVTPSDMVGGSLEIAQRPPVQAAVRLGFCPNWTPQASGLSEGVPAAHRDLYAQDGLTVTARDAAVAAAYRLHAEPEQVDTLLLVEEDAQAEAQRRLELFSAARQVVRFTGYAPLLDLELGAVINITHPRFGLENGKTGQIIALEPDWHAGRVAVEVLI